MLALLLKEYRQKYGITQEQLASDLTVDVRTLRRWENQETIIKDKEELRRLASKLGIESERLGLIAESITDKQASETLEHIWSLVDDGRVWEARSIAERLVSDLQTKARQTGSAEDLHRLALAHHASAYTKAMNTRVSEIQFPLKSYQDMEEAARLAGDSLLTALALTYEGDMYNRTGDVEKGLPLLLAAVEAVPPDDIAAKGNALQLIGRAHFKAENRREFERAMKASEDLAGQLTEKEITRGQYGLISVYEEYAKSYGLAGQAQKASDYLEKAYALGVPDTHWEMVLKTTNVMILIRGGEIQAGTSLALACIEECRRFGTIRLLERMYSTHRYLQYMKNSVGKAADALSDALNGPVEF